jgi:hypothetical protein
MSTSVLSSSVRAASSGARSATPSAARRRTGIAASALAVLFLLFDGGIKLVPIAPVVEAFGQLGWPVALAGTVGLLAIACTLLYALPRTAPLGALLLTGYLGGAIATQVRIGAPTFSLVFPLIVAALVWGGLLLRDERVRVLLPTRR